MAYVCPRCGKPVHRGYSSSAQMAFGLVGALFCATFGDFQCANCGKISRSEFPPEVQTKMTLGSLFMAAIAIAVLLFVFWLIAQK